MKKTEYTCTLHEEKNITVMSSEKKTLAVIIITVVMMVMEITSGIAFGSIALLSDGIHMGTHTLALLITLAAYIIARKNYDNPHFTFGTGKVSVLGGYTSAIALFIAALFMVKEAIERLITPRGIDFNESIIVAVIGLAVNLFSAWLLKDDHSHHHHGEEEHDHHHDHNIQAAYLHVLADALTSVLAIIALFAGKFAGALWLDPVVGILGAVVVSKWAIGLLHDTGTILLDFNNFDELKDEIKNDIEDKSNFTIKDFHIWKLDNNKKALILTLETKETSQAEQKELSRQYKEYIIKKWSFAHATIELTQL